MVFRSEPGVLGIIVPSPAGNPDLLNRVVFSTCVSISDGVGCPEARSLRHRQPEEA